MQGLPLPWADLERNILPARVADYSPAMLDGLAASGELTWCGTGSRNQPEWVVLALSDSAELLLPEPQLDQLAPWQRHLLEQLAPGAGYFIAHLAAMAQSGADPPSPALFTAGLWEMVWAGTLTNDTFAALRMRETSGVSQHFTPSRRLPRPRGRYAGLAPPPETSRPPALSALPGRWSLTPPRETNGTLRAHARAVNLLERHGLVARATAAGEALPGGFSGIYPVLRAMAEQGSVQRAYAVEGLGAAQFAMPGVIDRLRGERTPARSSRAFVLAACDPANPYGTTLPWPGRTGAGEQAGPRPARRPGASVVLSAGQLIGFLERRAESLLGFPPTDDDVSGRSGTGEWADQLATALAEHLTRLPDEHRRQAVTIKQVDGSPALSPPLGSPAELIASALERAGFRATPAGLRFRTH